MRFYPYILSISLFALISADNQTAEDILLKAFHRMDGINHSFKVYIKSSQERKKEKHFQVSITWPSDGNFLRQTRITSIETKRKKPSSFWEHRFLDGTKTKKWMSLPITGKLKDVSNNKAGKKEFSFAELEITDEDIKLHSNELLTEEKIDSLSAYVIESIKKNNQGKIKESKKLWIDINSYTILKVEFYTGSGRLYRSVTCADFNYVEEILFPMNIN